MLESGTDFAIFGLAMVSTVLLLAIGTAAGYYFGRQSIIRVVSSEQPASLPPRLAAGNCFELDKAGGAMGQDAAAVSKLMAAHRDSVPRELTCAVERLVFTSSQLAKRLRSLNDSESAAQIPQALSAEPPPPTMPPKQIQHIYLPPADSTVSLTATGTLTPEEMRRLAAAAGSVSDTDEDSSKRRYPYDCLQTVVPKIDGVASPARAARVRCHEISPHGMSFFWPDAPDFDRAMISLGTERNPIFMRADIVQSKAVFMHGEVQVLVDCRFSGRYEPSSTKSDQSAAKSCDSGTNLSVAAGRS